MNKTDIYKSEYLSDDEKEFLQLFRKIPPELRSAATEEIYNLAMLFYEGDKIKTSAGS